MKSAIESIILLLEREAGYHLISLLVILAGVVIVDAPARAAVGHDLVIFGLGVLSRSMAGKLQPPVGSSSTTHVSTDQVVETPPAEK